MKFVDNYLTYPFAQIKMLAVKPLFRILSGVGGIALLAFLGVYNQPLYPSTWQDEGFVMQGAISLVRYGKYAMQSVEGFRILDQPLIANGPGIVIPIAVTFALFGTGLWQARMVASFFLVLTGVLFFAVAKRLYGTWAAIISGFFLLALPQEGFLFLGRQVLGNVPTLGYFLGGYLLWLISLEKGSWKYTLGAGLLFGLSMVTKGQYGLLIPIFLVVAFVDAFFYRQIGKKNIVVVLATSTASLIIWNVVQGMLVGWGNYAQHLDAIRASSVVTVFAFRPSRIPGNIWYLITSGTAFVVVPGLINVMWACRQRTLASCRQLPLIVLVLVWSLWYTFVSVGWHRYALDVYVVGVLFSGKLVVDMISFLRKRSGTPGIAFSTVLSRVTVGLLVAASFTYGVWGLTHLVGDIVAQPDDSAQKFAYYLEGNINSQATIESWEWEIDALTKLKYHHPTNDWVDKMTAFLQFHDTLKDSYDPFAYRPDYLIDGPFSKWTGLYVRYLDSCCSLMTRIGPYDLYQVRNYAAVR